MRAIIILFFFFVNSVYSQTNDSLYLIQVDFDELVKKDLIVVMDTTCIEINQKLGLNHLLNINYGELKLFYPDTVQLIEFELSFKQFRDSLRSSNSKHLIDQFYDFKSHLRQYYGCIDKITGDKYLIVFMYEYNELLSKWKDREDDLINSIPCQYFRYHDRWGTCMGIFLAYSLNSKKIIFYFC